MENNTITENTISDGYPTVGDGGQVVLTVWPKGYSPPVYGISVQLTISVDKANRYLK